MLWAEEQIFTNCTVLFPEHPISGKRVGTLTDIFYHIYYNKGTKDWRLKVLSAFHHGNKDLHCKTVTKYNRQNLDKAMNHFWDSWEEATMFNFVQNIAAYVRYKIRSMCLAIILWMARKGLRLGCWKGAEKVHHYFALRSVLCLVCAHLMKKPQG